jgi:hypothetical protein
VTAEARLFIGLHSFIATRLMIYIRLITAHYRTSVETKHSDRIRSTNEIHDFKIWPQRLVETPLILFRHQEAIRTASRGQGRFYNEATLFNWDFSSNVCVQTGSGTHPASCPMGTGDPFLGGKARPGRDADHSPHLVPRS